jgi:hypothetical protein
MGWSWPVPVGVELRGEKLVGATPLASDASAAEPPIKPFSVGLSACNVVG